MTKDRLRRTAKLLSVLAGPLLFFSLTRAATSQEVPIPAPLGYVSDYAGVIDPATEAALARLIQDVEHKTTAEIAVLTVDSTKPLDAFQYSIKVFERWKIGKKGKDNGVLFLVAVNDRRMWITVGYGLEGILPDGKVGEVRDRFVVPHFKQGDYGKGILEGTKAIARVVAGEEGVPRRQLPRTVLPASPAVLFLGVLALLLLSGFALPLWARTHRRNALYLGGWHAPFGSGGYLSRGGGGWGGGGFSGGFGGFGGGSTGGGGAGGSW
jgi:uncharacterized protein